MVISAIGANGAGGVLPVDLFHGPGCAIVIIRPLHRVVPLVLDPHKTSNLLF